MSNDGGALNRKCAVYTGNYRALQRQCYRSIKGILCVQPQWCWMWSQGNFLPLEWRLSLPLSALNTPRQPGATRLTVALWSKRPSGQFLGVTSRCCAERGRLRLNFWYPTPLETFLINPTVACWLEIVLQLVFYLLGCCIISSEIDALLMHNLREKLLKQNNLQTSH